MRRFPPSFTYANAASEKSPRFVVAIVFDTDSLYLTSHAGIPNVPGIPIENVLRHPSAISQRIVPDEGRSEIGSMQFEALDVDGVLTQAFRDKYHTGGKDLRGRTVRLYLGYSVADFSQYQLFQTQKIVGVAYKNGVYSFKCADITREQRQEIFEPKRTTLTANFTPGDTTMHVVSTAGFEMVAHGSTWSDAPNQTVGYLKLGDMIVRYTGKTDSTFTGCTAGVLNSRAVPVTVDLTQANDQRSRVEEYIYLELPAPKLALAVLTGELYGQSGATLPDHWHLGIDADDWIVVSDFTNIGADLWHPTSENLSFVPRFAGLKKTDGKRFLEREVYQLIGCYPIVYSDGRLGLKRMNQVLADAPYLFEINENNAVSWSDLQYDMDRMANVFRVNWNYVEQGGTSGFTRSVAFLDASSVEKHGAAPPKTLEFKGLYGSRHTDATVLTRINALRDRYSHPPAVMTVRLLPSFNRIEVGDIGRVRLPHVRDYVGDGESIDRSFEVQRLSLNYATGEVTAELFGSTGRAGEVSIGGPGGEGPGGQNSLPDEWYTSEGTDLATVIDITEVGDVGVIDEGEWELEGGDDLTGSDAIYYYDGDLELPDGATIKIKQNVQLRIRGHFEINGDIDGVGLGLPGVADTPGFGTTRTGTPGFLGNSRGMDGLTRTRPNFRYVTRWSTLSALRTQGQYATVPYFDLSVVDGALVGLPSDLRGTSGGPGGKYQSIFADDRSVRALGGTGGNGGAGLCIVSRGLSVGLSGAINLSGGDSATPAAGDPGDYWEALPGAGGAGAPGALLVLLDGSSLSLPDFGGGRFVATTGHVGAPLLRTLNSPSGGTDPSNPFSSGSGAREGYLDPDMITDLDMSDSAYRIQYIPGAQTPAEDAPDAVPPPTNLSATGIPGGITVQVTLPAFDLFDSVQIYASSTNDRTASTLVQESKASTFTHFVGSAVTRYYWARCTRGAQVSEWYPEEEDSGVGATSS